MQPDSSLAQEPQKAPKKFPVLTVILVIALIGALAWAFTLNSGLAKAQGELKDLNGKYTALQAEKDQVSSELASTKSTLDETASELEATNAELETTKADLEKSQGETAALQAKIDTASQWVDVMVGAWAKGDTFAETLVKVTALGDAKQTELFTKYISTLSGTDLVAWLAYYFEALAKILQ